MIGGKTRKSKKGCKKIKTKNKKYLTRKSPPFHAGDCMEHIKKGKDGLYISKESSNGVYKWIKYNK